MTVRYTASREIVFTLFGYLPESVRALMMKNIVEAGRLRRDGLPFCRLEGHAISAFHQCARKWCVEKGNGRFCVYQNTIMFELEEDMALFLIEQPQGK